MYRHRFDPVQIEVVENLASRSGYQRRQIRHLIAIEWITEEQLQLSHGNHHAWRCQIAGIQCCDHMTVIDCLIIS